MKPALPDVKWKYAEGSAVTHKKTHGLYTIVGHSFLTGLGEPIPAYVYRQKFGVCFVQVQERFEDGRFTAVVVADKVEPSLRLAKKSHTIEVLATKVAEHRKSLCWTQAQLGKKLRWSHDQVSRLERGVVLEPARYRSAIKRMKEWGAHVPKKH